MFLHAKVKRKTERELTKKVEQPELRILGRGKTEVDLTVEMMKQKKKEKKKNFVMMMLMSRLLMMKNQQE